MARKHVASHAKRLQMHQQRHRKHVWKIFKKLARHKACYEQKGGMMLMGMGMRKKKKAGMMLYGMGIRKPGYKKRKIKLPAWVSKQIPKKGKRFPKVPKGFSKKAGWFWNKHKKDAEKKQSKASKFVSDIWKKGKETVGKVGKQAIDTIKTHAGKLADQGMQLLNDHADQFADIASKFIDQQADKYAGKASAKMSEYGKKKKGSGISLTYAGQKRIRQTKARDWIKNNQSTIDDAIRGRGKQRQSGLTLSQLNNRPPTLQDFTRRGYNPGAKYK